MKDWSGPMKSKLYRFPRFAKVIQKNHYLRKNKKV